MDQKRYAELAKKYLGRVQPSEKSSYSIDEYNALVNKMQQAKDMDPRLALIAKKMAEKAHSSVEGMGSGMNADLNNLKEIVRGSKPDLEEVIKVPGGEGGWIQDIHKVKGKIPVDASTIVPSSESTADKVSSVIKNVTDRIDSPTMMKELKGPEFTEAMAKKLGRTGLKAFSALAGPAVGVGAALATGDASAALPEALQSEEVGRGSDTQKASEMDRPSEGGYMSPERSRRLFEAFRNKY
jgi:hypothetical protein